MVLRNRSYSLQYTELPSPKAAKGESALNLDHNYSMQATCGTVQSQRAVYTGLQLQSWKVAQIRESRHQPLLLLYKL